MTQAAAPRQSPRGQARSRQILESSVRLFQDAGYQNVSIDDIGAAVGLTGPAVYRHFKGKYDILVQALLGQVTVVADLVEVASHQPAGEMLQRLVDDLAQLTVERDEAMLWRRENRHLEPADRARFRKAYSAVVLDIQRVILDGRPNLGDRGATFVAVALLSLFSSTRDIRGKLSERRAVDVLVAVAWSIIDVPFDADDPTLPPARPDAESRRPPAGRRARIIDAAADLFDEHGFYSVRIDDIGRLANTSVATLYQLFDSKARILQAVLFRGAEGLHYLTAETLERASTPQEALECLIGVYVRQSLGLHGRTMRILATDVVFLPADLREDFLAAEREYVAEWTAAISAQREDLSEADVRALGHAAIDVLTDLSQTRALRDQPGLEGNLVRLARAIVQPAKLSSANG